MIFACVGTCISTVIVGLGIAMFGLLPFVDAMSFGALISSVVCCSWF